MGSTFSGIELGKRSIMANTDAITTAGHNISNANTEGYSRQRVQIKEFSPLYNPDLTRPERPGMIGQGVDVQSINRIRDELLDKRIVAQSNQEGYWQTRSDYYMMLEQIYNEPDDISIRSNMDKFWESWQELSIHPESQAARQAVVTRAETLTDSIKQRWESLKGIGDLIDGDIEATVRQVNSYSEQIADLNAQIVRSKAMGDNPNDLLDRRDLLVDKLADLINITADSRDSDEFMVHVDGKVLVQGGIARKFELAPRNDDTGYSKIIWEDTGSDASFSGGKLGALVELRDVDVRSEIQQLNTMTMNFADLVNDVHRNAVGANKVTGLDFFVQHPFVENAKALYSYINTACAIFGIESSNGDMFLIRDNYLTMDVLAGIRFSNSNTDECVVEFLEKMNANVNHYDDYFAKEMKFFKTLFVYSVTRHDVCSHPHKEYQVYCNPKFAAEIDKYINFIALSDINPDDEDLKYNAMVVESIYSSYVKEYFKDKKEIPLTILFSCLFG